MWKLGETSILAQLHFRGDSTDTELLAACILRALARVEAVLHSQGHRLGAPRAREDGPRVGRAVHVKEHDAELSGLSKREALRRLGAQPVGRVARRT